MRKKILFFFLGFSFLVFVLLTAGYIVLTTSFAGESIENFINKHARWEEGQVIVQGISLDPLKGMQCSAVTVADKKNQWLFLQDIDLEWQIDFFPFQIIAPKMNVARLHLADLPQPSPEPKKKSFSFSLPRLSLPPVSVSCPDISIDQIVLGKKIFGQEMEYGLQSNLDLHAKNANIVANITGHSPGTGNAYLELALDDKENMNLEARMTEPDNGVLGNLLQMPKGARFSAKGQGKLADWNGQLTFLSPDWGQVESTLHLAITDKKIQGRLNAKTGLSAKQVELKKWLGEKNQIHLEAILRDNDIFIQQLTLTTLPGTVSANARFKQNHLQAELVADMHDTSKLKDFYLNLLPGKPLCVTLNGPLSNIDVKADIGAKHLDVPGFEARQIKVNFSGKLALDSQAQLQGDLQVSSPQIAPHHLRFHNFQANTFIRTSFTDLVMEHTKITSQELALSSREEILVDARGVALKGRLDFNRFHVASLEPYLGPDWKGNITGQVDVQGQNGNQQFNFSFSSRDLSSPQINLRELGGKELRLVGNGTVSPENVTWKKLRLIADQASFLSAGEVNWKTGNLNIQTEASLASLTTLNPELQGQARMKARIWGDMNFPSLRLFMDSPRVDYGQTSVQNIVLRSEFEPATRKGHVALDMRHLQKPIILRSLFKLEENSFHLLQATLEGLQVKAEASAHLLEGGKQGNLNLKVDSSNLQQIGEFLGTPLYGSISGTASGKWQEEKIRGQLSLQGNKMGLVSTGNGRVEINGRLTGKQNQPHLRLSAKTYNFSFADNQALHKAVFDLNGNLESATASIKAVGRTYFPFTLYSDLELEKQSQRTQITLAKLRGKLGPDDFYLQRPAHINISGQGQELSPVNIEMGQGKIYLEGKNQKDKISLACTLEKISTYLPSTLLPIQEYGSISLNSKVSGQPESPTMSVNFTGTDLIPAVATAAKHAFSLSGEATFHQEQLTLTSVFSNGPQNLIKLEGQAPVKINLSRLLFSLKGQAKAAIKGRTELNWVPLMFSLEDHTLNAMVWIDTQATWLDNDFSLAGEARIKGGKYEALSTGTILRNLDLALLFKDKDIDLDFNARDTQKGKIAAEASLHLSDVPSFTANLTSNNFLAVKTDLATAFLNTDLELIGDMKACTLKGDLVVNSAEIELSETPSSSFETLEVQEIDDSGKILVPKKETSAKQSPLTLAIHCNAPGHLFVRGRGLDSEWKASILVRGNASAPSLTGGLEVLRGKYAFAGRDFFLASEKKSRIQFSGNFPPDPSLDIHATSKVDDLVVKLLVQGVLSDFSFSLASEPSLPEDEILSRVLFGRSLDSISPIQVMHLALTLAQLTESSGSNFDVIGGVRNILGVDTINIESDGTNGVSVGVGKYLTDKIYVEANQSPDGSRGSLSVEMEVAPHLSLDTELGGAEGGKIELKWKRDY